MKVEPIPSAVFKRMNFYIDLVKMVAQRSTCRPDRKAGAIIIDDENRVTSMGYNGSPPGVPHCVNRGCLLYEGHCIGTLHAEMNALANLRVREDHLIMLCTLEPCLYCLKMLLAFKVHKILYLDSYRDPARDFFMANGGGFRIEDAATPRFGIQLRDRWALPMGIEMSRINIYGDLFQAQAYGTSISKEGKNIPVQDFYKDPKEDKR